jgi:hypothetical protein
MATNSRATVFIAFTLLISFANFSFSQSAASKDNTLTKREIAKGWKLLFDGKSTSGWHNYLQTGITGWQAKDGLLFTDGKSGDIVTDEEYEDFELTIDWKIEKGGNSGIFYFVVEEPVNARIHQSGPEFQIIDEENYPYKLTENQVTGSASDVLKPYSHPANPIGEWNSARIKSKKGKIEHWLNGKKILAYDIHSTEWKEAVKKSKFAEFNFAQVTRGKIGLQDHKHFVAYKNVKIRRL